MKDQSGSARTVSRASVYQWAYGTSTPKLAYKGKIKGEWHQGIRQENEGSNNPLGGTPTESAVGYLTGGAQFLKASLLCILRLPYEVMSNELLRTH